MLLAVRVDERIHRTTTKKARHMPLYDRIFHWVRGADDVRHAPFLTICLLGLILVLECFPSA